MAALTEAQLRLQIERFYDKARSDAVLGPIFADNVDDWPSHLDRLTDFWTSIMLRSGRYKGNPYRAHLAFADRLDSTLFDRWLTLWQQTASETFEDDVAACIVDKARRIADSLMSGLLFQPDRTPIASKIAARG